MAGRRPLRSSIVCVRASYRTSAFRRLGFRVPKHLRDADNQTDQLFNEASYDSTLEVLKLRDLVENRADLLAPGNVHTALKLALVQLQLLEAAECIVRRYPEHDLQFIFG